MRDSLRHVASVLTLRPAYPAWIDAEQGLAFSAADSGLRATRASALPLVTPRIRDCLVLRAVERKKSPRSENHAHGGR